MRRTTSPRSLANERTIGQELRRRPSELLWHRQGGPIASELGLDDNFFHYEQLAKSASRVRGCAHLGSYGRRLAVIRDNARHKRWCWSEEEPRWLVRERGYS